MNDEGGTGVMMKITIVTVETRTGNQNMTSIEMTKSAGENDAAITTDDETATVIETIDVRPVACTGIGVILTKKHRVKASPTGMTTKVPGIILVLIVVDPHLIPPPCLLHHRHPVAAIDPDPARPV